MYRYVSIPLCGDEVNMYMYINAREQSKVGKMSAFASAFQAHSFCAPSFVYTKLNQVLNW